MFKTVQVRDWTWRITACCFPWEPRKSARIAFQALVHTSLHILEYVQAVACTLASNLVRGKTDGMTFVAVVTDASSCSDDAAMMQR